MSQRAISEAEVKLTLHNPDRTSPGDAGATNSYKYIDGRIVRVTSALTTEGIGKHKMTTVTIITVAIEEN